MTLDSSRGLKLWDKVSVRNFRLWFEVWFLNSSVPPFFAWFGITIIIFHGIWLGPWQLFVRCCFCCGVVVHFFNFPSTLFITPLMMWLSQKTYLRLLQDVYIAQQSESEDDVTLDTSKLNKLIAYLKQCPKRLTNVCRTLYHNIKKNYHTRTEKQKKRSCVLSADFLIFQVSVCVAYIMSCHLKFHIFSWITMYVSLPLPMSLLLLLQLLLLAAAVTAVL